MDGYKFKEGDVVCWDEKQAPGTSGKGIVCGAATMPMAVIGRLYIVKTNVFSTFYPFSCITIQENLLKKVSEE